MFCSGCGVQLGQPVAFCPQCGQNQSSARRSCSDGGPAWTPNGPVLAVSWRGGEVALGIVLVAMALLLITGVTVILQQLGTGQAWGTWLASHAIGAVMIFTIIIFAQRQGPFSLAALGLCRPRVSWAIALVWSGLSLGFSIALGAAYVWVVRSLGIELLIPPAPTRDMFFGGLAVIWSFEALAGVTPITEELFFRGFVMAGLVNRWGTVGAAVGSALIFALFHVHPAVLVPIFGTGLMLAASYRATGSLWSPIITHCCQNAIVLVGVIYGG